LEQNPIAEIGRRALER